MKANTAFCLAGFIAAYLLQLHGTFGSIWVLLWIDAVLFILAFIHHGAQRDIVADAEYADELRRRDRGFSLLEMLIVLAISAILLAIIAPNPSRILAALNTKQAREDVTRIAQATSALTICTATNNAACAASVSPLVPPNASVTVDGYTYVMAGWPTAAWTYRATAVAPNGISFYTDQTAIVRCQVGGPAGPVSPQC